jgi:hypothetical protein
MHDADAMKGMRGVNCVQRNAQYLRSAIRPPLRSDENEIDRHIRLVFTSTGPIYMRLETVSNEIEVIWQLLYSRTDAS